MANGTGLCVLLVDDDDDTLAVLQRLLAHDGYRVCPAHSAEEALRVAAERHCDMIVSDISMPGQDGLELMRQLKRQHALKGIAVSGYTQDADVSAATAAGFDRYIAKPLDFPKLISAIKELVG